MRKIDVLTGVLKKIQEQDDAVASIVTEPTSSPELDMDTPLPPPNYDNEFFKQLRVGDVFIDQDIPEIYYKVIEDPVMDTETEMVSSLQCEVAEAPEGNAKGVVVGDQFDAITSMPKMSDMEAPSDDELPPTDEPLEEPTSEPTLDEPTEAKKGGKKFKMGKSKNAPNQPEKKKKGEGYSLKRRFPGIKEAATTGVVQEIRADGKVAVRMGKWHKVFDSSPGGIKAGDTVEIDGDKITKVISSQDPPVFSKVKS